MFKYGWILCICTMRTIPRVSLRWQCLAFIVFQKMEMWHKYHRITCKTQWLWNDVGSLKRQQQQKQTTNLCVACWGGQTNLSVEDRWTDIRQGSEQSLCARLLKNKQISYHTEITTTNKCKQRCFYRCMFDLINYVLSGLYYYHR